MIKRLYSILSIIFLMGLSSSLFAQEAQFIGAVRNYFDGSKIKEVNIDLVVNGSVEKTLNITNGNYDIRMDYGKLYTVVFRAAGMMDKSLVFDTRDVPMDVQNGLGMGFQANMDLYPELEGFDLPELKKPVAKFFFDNNMGDAHYDEAYTEEILGVIEPALEKYEAELARREKEMAAKQKEFDAYMKAGDKAMAKAADGPGYEIAIENYGKAQAVFPEDVDAQIKYEEAVAAKKSWELDQEVALETQKMDEFEKFMAAGDKALSANSFEEAKSQYQEAAKLFPDNERPASKIAEIDKKIAALAEAEQQYNDLVVAADDAFKNQKYDEAIVKYTEAKSLKPNERYLADQIQECEKLKALQQDELAKQQQFDALVQKAKDAENNNDLASAIGMYSEAINIMADDEISSKIEALKKRLDEEKNQAQKQAEYDAIVLNAEAAEKEGNITAAITLYDQALAIFEDKTEIRNKRDALQKQLDDAKAAQEEEAKQKELAAQIQKDYDEKIEAAQKAFKAEQFDESVLLYREALALKEDETYPQEEIARIETIIQERHLAAEAKAKAEADEQQAQLAFEGFIANADKAVLEGNYDEAKSFLDQADEVMPTNTIVPDKRKEIDAIIARNEADQQAEADRLAAEEKTKQELYKKQEAKADKLFEAGNYEGAITAYDEALAIDDSQDYAKSRKDEAQRRLDEIASQKSAEELAAQQAKELEEKYDNLIVQGQNARANKDFEQAITYFTDALKVKPVETYPQEEIDALTKMIKERDELLAKQNALDQQKNAEAEELRKIEEAYQKVLAAGDVLLEAQEYEAAIAKYEEALPIKKDNKEAQERITGANKAFIAFQEAEEQRRIDELKKLQTAQKDYRGIIKDADKFYDTQDFEQAITYYKKALELKPDEGYPKEQIKLAEADWEIQKYELAQKAKEEAAKQALKDQYMTLKGQAQEAQKALEYDKAIGLYKEALALNKNDKDIPREIIKIETLIAEQAARDEEQRKADSAMAVQEELMLAERSKQIEEINKKYQAFIEEADVAFELRDWDNAKSLYRQAENVKPEASYPSTQVAKISELIAQEKAAKMADKLAEERQREEEAEARKRQEQDAQRQRAMDFASKDHVTEEEALAYFKSLRTSEEERRLNDFEDTKNEFEASKLKVNEDHNLLVDENVRQLNQARMDLVDYKETEAEMHNVVRVNNDSYVKEVQRAKEEDLINHDKVIIENESELNSFKEFHNSETKVAEKSHDTYREELTAYQKELEARERALDIQGNEIIQNNVEMLNKSRVHIDDKRLESELYHAEVRGAHDKTVSQITLGDDDTRKMHNTVVNKNEVELEKQKAALVLQNERRHEIHMEKHEAHEDDKRSIEVSYDRATNDAERLHKNNREALEAYKKDIQINQIDADKIHSDERIKHEEDLYRLNQKDAELNNKVNLTVEQNQRNLDHTKQDMADVRADINAAQDKKIQETMQELEDWRNNKPEDSDEYRNLLAKQFGEGIHETTDQLKDEEGNVTQVIIRRIVVSGNKGDDYKKIIHKYGAVHYKNGKPISERTWMMDTKRD